MMSRLGLAKLMLLGSTLVISSASFANTTYTSSAECSAVQFLPRIQKIMNDRFKSAVERAVSKAYEKDGVEFEDIVVGEMKLIPVKTISIYTNQEVSGYLVESPNVTVKSKSGVDIYYPENTILGASGYYLDTVLDKKLVRTGAGYRKLVPTEGGTLETTYNLRGEIKSKICKFDHEPFLGTITTDFMGKRKVSIEYFYKNSEGVFVKPEAFEIYFNFWKAITIKDKDGEEKVTGYVDLLRFDITDQKP